MLKYSHLNTVSFKTKIKSDGGNTNFQHFYYMFFQYKYINSLYTDFSCVSKCFKEKMAVAIKKDFSTSRYRYNVLSCRGKDIPFITLYHIAKTYKGAKVQLHAF